MEFIIVLILSVILVLLSFMGLAIKILVKKGGKFPNTHVSQNRYLTGNGIYCAQTQDRMERAKLRKNIDYKNVRMIKYP